MRILCLYLYRVCKIFIRSLKSFLSLKNFTERITSTSLARRRGDPGVIDHAAEDVAELLLLVRAGVAGAVVVAVVGVVRVGVVVRVRRRRSAELLERLVVAVLVEVVLLGEGGGISTLDQHAEGAPLGVAPVLVVRAALVTLGNVVAEDRPERVAEDVGAVVGVEHAALGLLEVVVDVEVHAVEGRHPVLADGLVEQDRAIGIEAVQDEGPEKQVDERSVAELGVDAVRHGWTPGIWWSGFEPT